MLQTLGRKNGAKLGSMNIGNIYTHVYRYVYINNGYENCNLKIYLPHNIINFVLLMLEEYAKIKNGAPDLNQTVRIQKLKSLAQDTAEFAKVLLYEL